MERVINAKTVTELFDVFLEVYEGAVYGAVGMGDYEDLRTAIESRLVLDCNVDLTPYSEGDREAQ